MENRTVYDLLQNIETMLRKDPSLYSQRSHKNSVKTKKNSQIRLQRTADRSVLQKRAVSTQTSQTTTTKKKKTSIQSHKNASQSGANSRAKITKLPDDQSRDLKIQRMFFLRWMKKLAEKLEEKGVSESDGSELITTNDSESLSSIGKVSVKRFYIDSDLDFELPSPPPPLHPDSSQGTFDNTELTDTLDPEQIHISGSFDMLQSDV